MKCEDCGGTLTAAGNAEITAAAAGIGFYETCLRAIGRRSGIMFCPNCGRLTLPPRQEIAQKGKAIKSDETARGENNHSTAL